ncbi:MAG: hypothetical protein ABH803_00490 [Candidatus Micrarchaeota archaeon]
MDSVYKSLFALIALILVVLLLFSFSTPASSSLDEEQARAFVQADLEGVEAFRLESVKQEGEKWFFDVLVLKNAHSACPSLVWRHYQLFPISFRLEPALTSCAKRTAPLIYPEEAMLNTASLAGFSNAYGCAFNAVNPSQDSINDCKYFSEGEFTALNADSGDFVVLWVNEDNTEQKTWLVVDKSTGLVK